MILLHTSDWHLGAMDGEHSLAEDQEYFIHQILKIIDREHVDAVLLAGDVFDRSISSVEGIRLYNDAMSEIVLNRHVPVIAIAGNHDSAERLANCRGLLGKAGLYVCGTLEEKPQKVTLGNADIYLLPWFTEQKARAQYPEHREEIHSLQDAYQLVCDRIREDFVPGQRHIALAHAFIANAETSGSDRAAEIGKTEFTDEVGTAACVSAEVFADFDYVALGHIHKPQNIGENVRYSGTPMPYSFGREEMQEKSVTLLDTESMERRVLPLPLLHKRTTLKDSYDKIISNNWPEEVRNGYVRIEATDLFLDTSRREYLASMFPNYLSMTGIHYEDENAAIRMSMKEFEELQGDPMKIFERFCVETTGNEANEHLKALFQKAVTESDGEERV